MKGNRPYSPSPNRQKAVEPAVARIRSAQTFLIQRPTLHRRIFQIALAALFVSACLPAHEAYAAVGSKPPVAYPINGPLDTGASGYRNYGSGGLNNVGGNGNCWSFAPNSQTNARNLNFNSGNVNPLNNNERAYGFSVRPSRALGTAAEGYYDVTMEYSFKELHRLVTVAYLKAREEERSKISQLDFETNVEDEIKKLTRSLHARTWRPQPLDWFVNLFPTVREVFAPKFRDRVVSHVLFNLISPIFERYFVHDSFSCRVGKGTLVGIERLEYHIRSITDNYRHEAYSLNYDIRAYFMSIDRAILLDMIRERLARHQHRFPDAIDYGFADYLIETFLTRDPLEGCVYHGDPALIGLIRPGKSLRDQKPGVGIPIGDVLNQLCSNIYLTAFDQFIHRVLHIKNAVRYVDDGKMLHRSREYLAECRGRADEFLRENLHLTLHPDKTTITNLSDTTYFLGAALKPYRRYVCNEVADRFCDFIRFADEAAASGDMDSVAMLSEINSHLGYLSHFDAKKIIGGALSQATYLAEYFDFTKNYTKAILKPKSICNDTHS